MGTVASILDYRTRTNELDLRMLAPIQIIDIVFRQGLKCPFLE